MQLLPVRLVEKSQKQKGKTGAQPAPNQQPQASSTLKVGDYFLNSNNSAVVGSRLPVAYM